MGDTSERGRQEAIYTTWFPQLLLDRHVDGEKRPLCELKIYQEHYIFEPKTIPIQPHTQKKGLIIPRECGIKFSRKGGTGRRLGGGSRLSRDSKRSRIQ